jgi:hypothetical protein
MLVIEYKDERGGRHYASWHYSQPLPEGALRSRVLKITADGDELDLLLDAITKTIKQTVTIDAAPAPQLTEGTK